MINMGEQIKHTLDYIVIYVTDIRNIANKGYFKEKERIINMKNSSEAFISLIDKDQIILDNIKEYDNGFKKGHQIIGVSTKTAAKIRKVERC